MDDSISIVESFNPPPPKVTLEKDIALSGVEAVAHVTRAEQPFVHDHSKHHLSMFWQESLGDGSFCHSYGKAFPYRIHLLSLRGR